MKLAVLLGFAVFVAACTPGSVSTTSTTTQSTSPTTSPTTTITSISGPELSLDPPSVPIVIGEDATFTVAGYVASGSAVGLVVTDADGSAVFETNATLEKLSDGPYDAYFQTDVTLAPGSNIVIIARNETGSTESTIHARYEPAATTEFAFLTMVSDTELLADFAQWLTGDEANQAAYEDGVIDWVEEGVPNDYYIRNVNPRLRTLPLASDARVWLNTARTGPVATIEVGLDEWLGLFDDGEPWDPEADDVPVGGEPHETYFGAGNIGAAYWLYIVDDEVIAIEHQYRP